MAISKLERPTYVHNWVRYNYADVLKTANALVRFATNLPQVTYRAGLMLAHDRIAFGLDRATALNAAITKGHKKSRQHVLEFVKAFYDYDETIGYFGLKNFDQYVEPYRVTRDVVIPVKPLIVVAKDGKLRPIFVVGWASMPLTDFQQRLLMTIVEDAVFSLTDFQGSPGDFVSFPRTIDEDGLPQRKPLVWGRGDFKLLSDVELKEQMQIYFEALVLAKAQLAGFAEKTRASERRSSKPSDDQGELFDPPRPRE